jgi:hypothetical protein
MGTTPYWESLETKVLDTIAGVFFDRGMVFLKI